MPKPKRPRRVLALLTKIFLFFVLGVVVVVGLALLSVNLGPVSRVIAQQVNQALESTFKGRLVLHRLGHVDFGGVLDAELEVYDPAGQSVLRARDVDVRLFWPGVVWNALINSSDPLLIPITRVAVASIDIDIVDTGSGTPTLAGAFEPKQPAAVEEGGGATEVVVDALAVESLHVRGSLKSTGPIDADLQALAARLRNGAGGTHLVLENLELVARRVPHIDQLTGRLTADVTLPPNAEPSAVAPPDAAPTRGPTTAVQALKPPPPLQRILATFAGELAGSRAAVDVRMIGEELDATFDADSLSPATVSKLVPALSPAAPAGLAAKLTGTLDDLAFEARLRQEAALVKAQGRARKDAERSHVTARVDTTDVDVSRIIRGAASTRLNVGADVVFAFDERGGEGSYHVVSRESRIGLKPIPVTTIEGKLRLPSDQSLVATGSVEIAEPGAPTHVEYDIRSGRSGNLARVSSTTRINRPARIRELSGGLLLSGTITSQTQFDSAADKLDVKASARLHELQHPGLKARKLNASFEAHGSAGAPDIGMTAQLAGVTAGGRYFSSVQLAAQGTPAQLRASASARGKSPDLFELRATLVPGSDLLVRSPELRVEDTHGSLRISAASVGLSGQKVRVSRLVLDGPGRAELSASYGAGLEALDLNVEQLDAAKVLRILGIKGGPKSAKVDLRAKLENSREPRGTLVADLTELGMGKLKDGTARAKLALEGGKLSGDAHLALGRAAKTQIVFDQLKLPLSPGALEAMTGDVSLAGELDLTRLQSLFPLGGLERAEGQLRFDVTIRRPANAQGLPVWHAKIETQSLVLVEERPDVKQAESRELAERTEPRTLRGIDLALDASLENHEAKLQTRLFDSSGDLLQLTAAWKDIQGRHDLMNPRRALMNAPFVAELRVPSRAIEKLPVPIRPLQVEGQLELQVNAEGTLADPRLSGRVQLSRFRPTIEQKGPAGIDLELLAEYTRRAGQLQLNAHSREHKVLDLQSRWRGNAADIASQPRGKSPITADVELALDGFPVELVPALQHRHVAGKVSGTARLEQFGQDARFALDLETNGLRVDRLSVDKVTATVRTLGAKLDVRTQLTGRAGKASAELQTGMVWGDQLVPTLDEQLAGALTAHGFRLSTLLPIMDGSLSELDGKLDADIRASIEGGTPRLTGRATLTEGSLQIPAIGQRFHDISAQVALSPDGIRIDDVRARGTTGGFEASAHATLQGLTPVAAKATLRIDEGDKLPLTIEGEAVGDAWGSLEASYQHDEASKTNNVRVSLNKLNLELPPAPPRGIQGVEAAEHIRVGFFRRDRDFVPIALQPLQEPSTPSEYKTVVVVELGEMRIEKGQQVEVGLGGRVEAKLGPELDVRGEIHTRRGELDISGKKFHIERGSVTFTGGQPDNPIISAVARHDAPAGYTVYAEYTGTASRGKLRLSSEPPLSQDEILTLLMFGTPDGAFGAGSGDSLSTAVGVAGGTAAQGLNRALSDITDLDVSARVDTSTGAPRPELVLQVSSRVAARVTQALGEPSPGQSPDRTFLTVDLRLASTWSLSTMIGDRGASALDLIWRKRY